MTPALFPPTRLRIAAEILGAVVATEGPNCCPKHAAARALAHADALIEAAGYNDTENAALFQNVASVIRSVVVEHAAVRTAPPVVAIPPDQPDAPAKPGKTKPNRT